MTAQCSVLLVDDQPRVLESLCRALRGTGIRSLTASDGLEALALLAREPIDVIVSDELMPGMSGTELLSQVRKSYPHITRILLTGDLNVDTALRAINEGEIYRFLQKPTTIAELVTTVRQAFVHKQFMAEAYRLLGTAREQRAVLQRLETTHPGITEVETDPRGWVVVDDGPAEWDLEALLAEMKALSERYTNARAG